MSEILRFVLMLGAAAFGFRLLFQTRSQLAEAELAHRRRLDARLARGSDAYADELLSLQSYPPIRNIRQRRWFGALLLSLSFGVIVLSVFSPE